MDHSEHDCHSKISVLCRKGSSHHHHRDSSPNSIKHLKNYHKFADALIKEIKNHCDLMFNHRIKCFLESFSSIIPKTLSLCDRDNINQRRKDPIPNHGIEIPSSQSQQQPVVSVRVAIQRQTITVKKVINSIIDYASQLFSDICKDTKPLIDILEVSILSFNHYNNK